MASDPLPYRLTITPSGDPELDRLLRDASRLAALRESAPVGPFALISRAELDLERFDRVLRSLGHYDAAIRIRIGGLALDDPTLLPWLEERPAAPPIGVEVAITPGPVYRLGLVRLDGPVPDPVRALFDLTPGAPAKARVVLESGETVLRALREDGFALARVAPPDALVDHDTRTLDVIYTAEPGPRLVIGAISIRGLERLREDAVRRRLGLRPGERYDPRRLEAARRDLLASGLIAWARFVPGDAPDQWGRLPMTLELAERPARAIRFAGEFSSDTGLSLSGSWTHRNLWGGGEQLVIEGVLGQLDSDRADRVSYAADIGLRIPDLWTRDLDLNLQLGAFSERLDAYDREGTSGGVALERALGRGLAASAGLAFEAPRVTQDGPTEEHRVISLPATLDYDGTDDPLDPRRGLRVALQMVPAQDVDDGAAGFWLTRLAGSAYLDLTRPLASLSEQRPAMGDTVLAGRLVLGGIAGAEPDEVPANWRFHAGGASSVRGFPFQSIGPRTPSGRPAGGNALFEASAELRQRLGSRWGAVTFVDSGAVSTDGVPGSGALAIGVGIGVRYFTPIGPIRADLATPLTERSGDSPFQLYIGIGQAF